MPSLLWEPHHYNIGGRIIRGAHTMDPVTVAISIATAAASGVGAGFVKRAGEKTFDTFAEISGKLSRLFRGRAAQNPEFDQALKSFEAAPSDQNKTAALERIVRQAYLHDDDFATELNNLARVAQRDAGDLIMQIVHVQSGAQATVIGKSVGKQ